MTFSLIHNVNYSPLTRDSDCLPCKSTFGRVNIKKRLIVCCDGTFSGVDKGTDDYLSNVGRLSRAISRVRVTESGERIPQVVYYQPGVGTGSLTYIGKQRQGMSFSNLVFERLGSCNTGAFGGSLAENVCEAYNFLATNWGLGDEICIFGFSRGAYTARSLAGFICNISLLKPLMMNHFFEIYDAWRNRGNKRFDETKWATEALRQGELRTVPQLVGRQAFDYKATKIEHLRQNAHHHIKIKVVGVWDTVGSLHATNWFGQAGDDTTFHTTKLSPSESEFA